MAAIKRNVRKKTNNSYLWNKVELRLRHLPEDPVVLDCYGGAGVIWRAVAREYGRPIECVGIDQVDYARGLYLPGDNLAYLRALDLTRFNVIDLDAYGVPYEQLATLCARGYHGRVFVTFIQSVYGSIPHGLLYEVGFAAAMVEKTPSLFYRRGWQYFQEWLAQKGVQAITHRSHAQKHYVTFIL